MAETHELRLKINAAAARAGAREFVAAINSIKTAVRALDRDSAGAFTRLKKNISDAAKGSRVKLNIVDRSALRNLESYSRLAANAVKATGNTARSAANAASRMSTLSTSYSTVRTQVDALTSSVARLNTQLAKQTTVRAPSIQAAAPGGASGGASSAMVADQAKVQRALETTRLQVERLSTQLMKIGGFQTMSELGRSFRDFSRAASDGTMSAADFAKAQNTMRSAVTNSSTALVTLTTKARDEARASRESAAAARERERATLSAGAAMRKAEVDTARMATQLRALGDTAGVERINQAMNRLRSQLSGTVANMSQVRTANASFAESLSRARVNMMGLSDAQSKTSRTAAQLAKEENNAAVAARRLERDMRSSAAAAAAADRSFRSATGGVRGLENAFSGSFQAASLFRTALGTLTLGTFTKEVFRAGDALEQFNITMEVASGSSQAAAADLTFINDIAQKLGTNLTASRDAFSKFAVSSDIAGVSGQQTRQIFESVSTAMSVLGRGTEDQKLAFLALEQMMSKGVISAEELRRQLGERLPGAVSLMAKSVGVSVAELQKMLKAGELISSEVLPKFAAELDKTFGSQLNRTFNRAGSNLGRLQTAFSLLLEEVAGAGFLDELSIQFRDLAGLLQTEGVKDAARAIGEGLADAARMGGEALMFLIDNVEEVGYVLRNVFTAVAAGAIARFIAALAVSGQQMLVARAAATSLAASMTGTTAKIAAAGVAAGVSTKQITAMQTAMTGAGASAGKMAGRLGAAARVFGFLGGPIGIATTALLAAPALWSMFSSSAESAAMDYSAAIRDMEVTTFRFFDRVRDAAKESPATAILAQTTDVKRANELLQQAIADGGVQDSTDGAFAAILGDSTIADGVRKTVSEIQAMDSALRDPSKSFAEQVKLVDELKKKMVEVRLNIPEEAARNLEEAMLPIATAVKAIEDKMKTLDMLTGGQADKMAEFGEKSADASVAVTAIRDGIQAIGESEISPELRQLLESKDTGLTDTLALLEFQMENIGDRAPDVAQAFTDLLTRFRENKITAAEFATEMASLQPKIAGVAESASNASGFVGELGAEAIDTSADALELAEELANAQAAADAAAAGAVNAANGFASAGAAAAGAAAQVREYTAALDASNAARNAVQQTADEYLAESEIRVQIDGMEGLEKAVATELFQGKAGRALKKAEAEVARIRSSMNEAAAAGGNLVPVGVMESFNQDLRDAEANVRRIKEQGTLEATTLFNNKEDRKSSGSGKKTKEELSALQEFVKAQDEYIQNLAEENMANELLASGMTKSAEAARIVAEAQANGANLTQQQTMEFLAQAEAAELLNRKLSELANDPVNDWMNGVASWREAGQAIETEVFESLGDAISQFAQTGKFDFEALGASILATATDIIADKAVKELATLLGGNTTGGGEGGFGLGGFLSDLFGNGGSAGDEGDPFAAGGMDGQAAGQQIMMAMQQGGQQAAMAISQAMGTASGQITAGMTTGGATAGSTMATQVSASGATAGTTMGTAITTGGSTAAAQMGAAVQSGSITGGISLGDGVIAGSETGGGTFADMLGGLFGGGEGGGIGGLFSGLFGGGGGGGGGFLSSLFGGGGGGGIMSFVGSLFGSGGGVVGGGGPAIPTVMAPAASFRQAPRYAMGTPNVSGGVPAILHDNEAVVPLTGGRKIPVEGGGGGGGSQTINQTFNISTPDADSFRKSQTQIASDAAMSGQRAMSKNR